MGDDGVDAVSSTAPPAKKKYVFASRHSGLSSAVDQMWGKSMAEFTNEEKKPLALEKKSLGEVLSKISTDAQRESEDASNKPTFVFGSNVSARVLGQRSLCKKLDGDSPESKTVTDLMKGVSGKSSFTQENQTEKKDAILREEADKAAAEAHKKQKERETMRESSSNIIVTGEEEDNTINSYTCKIHSFDKDKSSWVERGLCQLKINERSDNDIKSYRIVARTLGAFRVVINSMVFPDMTVERVDERRSRISAMVEGSTIPHIFLLTTPNSKADLGDKLLDSLIEVRDRVRCLEDDGKLSRKRKASESEPEKAASEEEADGASGDSSESKDASEG